MVDKSDLAISFHIEQLSVPSPNKRTSEFDKPADHDSAVPCNSKTLSLQEKCALVNPSISQTKQEIKKKGFLQEQIDRVLCSKTFLTLETPCNFLILQMLLR